jgi:hypothetical protein
MKAHIMAHKVVAAPVTVLFKTYPAKWTLIGPKHEAAVDAGLAVFSSDLGNRAQGKFLPAWEIREEFLKITETEHLKQFLHKTGGFHSEGFSGLTEWQTIIAKMMTISPENWGRLLKDPTLAKGKVKAALSKIPQVHFQWSKGKPSLAFWTGFTLRAIVATIQVDHVRGARFSSCQRPDCHTVYQLESLHKRKYCSHECGHLESMRRTRAAKKAHR